MINLPKLPQTEESVLEKAITAATLQLDSYPACSPEYAATVDQITKLNALKPTKGLGKVDPTALATVLGNLLGIMIIVGHERDQVMVSKAVSFVMKPFTR